MQKARVAILRTKPETVRRDYHRLMNLARYQDHVEKGVDTALKVNLSCHFFYPGSSTAPWQLDGVIGAMTKDGYEKDLIHACHNRTVVIDAHLGERENRHLDVVLDHGIRNVHLYEREEWVDIHDAVGDLADQFLCLNDVFPRGFSIPKRLIGANIIHLPTMKTDALTTTSGAMMNAFGGLLNEQRHWTQPVINETLVDLLMIQKKIHRGVFAVMDGTFAGDGPGPRCMMPYVKNVLLASDDQVALDAVAAKLMGFDPLTDCKFVRLAHDAGLGVGDVRDIELVGDVEAGRENWRFDGPNRERGFASKNQPRTYWAPLKSWLAPWANVASVVYHDLFWYPQFAKGKMAPVIESPWGRLFANWGNVPTSDRGFPDVGAANPELIAIGVKHFAEGMRLVGMAVKESPELRGRARRIDPRAVIASEAH
jgi:uncharacterized protein (DUF362 family)